MTPLASLTLRDGLLTERLDVDADGADLVLFRATDDCGELGPCEVLRIPAGMVPGLRAALEHAPAAVDPRQGVML